MTCWQVSCVLDEQHSGDCEQSKIGPYKCPDKHWIYFASPRAQTTMCNLCAVIVRRGDPQP